jgi:hypothetical protein
VTELGATGTANAGLLPYLWNAVFRSLKNFGWFGTAERAAAVFIDNGLDLLSWQHVRYENYATVVTGNKDATVRDFFDVQDKILADPVRSFTHLARLPCAGSGKLGS